MYVNTSVLMWGHNVAKSPDMISYGDHLLGSSNDVWYQWFELRILFQSSTRIINQGFCKNISSLILKLGENSWLIFHLYQITYQSDASGSSYDTYLLRLTHLGFYSLNSMTSYHQISQIFEAARLALIVSLLISRLSRQRCCRGGWQISELLENLNPNSRLRAFARSCGKTSAPLTKRGSVCFVITLIQSKLLKI